MPLKETEYEKKIVDSFKIHPCGLATNPGGTEQVWMEEDRDRALEKNPVLPLIKS